MKRFYITTPLYYVNDRPHLGTAYSTVMADVLNRYHLLFGYESLFLTGTDEHGQKCQEAAEKRQMPPQAHCDDMIKNFKAAWETLDIKYDIFFRTTDEFHKKAVQQCLKQLHDKGDIYSDSYEGWYSVSEEIFYTEKDLVDGKSPTGREVTKISEKNYFFKMSKYQQQLIDHIEKNPKFIQPDSRRNEVLGFLRQPLEDLCISRPKHRLSWGIEIPFDKDYVTYVWFDALLNYATGVGYQQPERQTEFQKWWQETGPVHLLGKDIIITHSVYWTTMLLALGVSLPKQIFAHGWILNKDAEKMSKSKGEVINPLEIIKTVGVDGLRYYFCRDIHFGNDAPLSYELVINRVNNDLANNMGNLYSRTTNLIGKYFDGKIPELPKGAQESVLATECRKLPSLVRQDVEHMNISGALERIIEVLNLANRMLEQTAPWKLAKTDLPQTAYILLQALATLRVCGILLLPVMPTKMGQLLKRLNVQQTQMHENFQWPGLTTHSQIEKGEPLFPRIDFNGGPT